MPLKAPIVCDEVHGSVVGNTNRTVFNVTRGFLNKFGIFQNLIRSARRGKVKLK